MRQFKKSDAYITDRTDNFNKFLQEISKYPVLTPTEEVELARTIKLGGPNAEDAKNKLIVCNLRFAVTVAKQYQTTGVPIGDLVNEAALGLSKAADRYDDTMGFKFISYAVWWIRQSIMSYISSDSNLIYRPMNHVNVLSKIRTFRNEFLLKNGYEPSEEIIQKGTGLSMDKIKSCHISNAIARLDGSIGDDSDMTLGDFLSSDSSTDSDINSEDLHRRLVIVLDSLLDKIDSKLIKMHYGIGYRPRTLQELTYEFGLSKERLRQRRNRALVILRNSCDKEALKQFLG